MHTVSPPEEEVEALRSRHGAFFERSVEFTTHKSGNLRSVAIRRPQMRAAVLLVPVDIYRQAIVVREVGETDFFFPGGGVEPGETIEEAASRELEEELGLEEEGSALKALWWWTGNTLDGPTTVANFVFLQSIVGEPETRAPDEIAEIKALPGAPTEGRYRQLILDALSDTGMLHQWGVDFQEEQKFGTG